MIVISQLWVLLFKFLLELLIIPNHLVQQQQKK